MLLKQKPIVVKDGSASAKIYPISVGGKYRAWSVVYYDTFGRRRKINRARLQDAKSIASIILRKLNEGSLSLEDFGKAEQASYMRTLQILRPATSKPIETVAAEYAEAVNTLGPNVSLIEAVAYYARHHPKERPHKPMPDILKDMLAVKRQNGLSELHMADLESRVGKFVAEFGKPINQISGLEIEAWLLDLKVAPRTRNNYREAIRNFFEFAKSRNYLPEEWNQFNKVSVAKVVKDRIEIFTCAEMRQILDAALKVHRDFTPFLLVGAFAGLRSSEIQRLEWMDVRLDSRHLVVHAKKTGPSRRIVPIQDNLAESLAGFRKESGKLCRFANTANCITDITLEVRKTNPEFNWKYNGLRHSYISYRVVQTNDVKKVALECGNSPQMIFDHYREIVTEAQAKEWFSIRLYSE